VRGDPIAAAQAFPIFDAPVDDGASGIDLDPALRKFTQAVSALVRFVEIAENGAILISVIAPRAGTARPTATWSRWPIWPSGRSGAGIGGSTPDRAGAAGRRRRADPSTTAGGEAR
jgi:hypothetical protein